MSTLKPANLEDHESLKKCLLLVEGKFGMDTHDSWTESAYRVLSDHITTASKRTVSTNTLRRLYDKVVDGAGDYQPKVETKNALAIYLGYKDWYEFRTDKKHFPADQLAAGGEDKGEHLNHGYEAKGTSRPPDNQANLFSKPAGSKTLRWIIYSALLTAVVGTALWYLVGKSDTEQTPYVKIIRINNKTNQQPPFAAEFKLEFEGYKPDSLHLESHEGDLGSVQGTNNYFSTRYVCPGYYWLFVLYKGKRVASKTMVLPSNGWKRYIVNGTNLFDYPESSTFYQAMNLTEGAVQELALKLKHALRSTYRNIGNLPINTDDFVIEARIKNHYLVNDLDCYSAKIKLIGDSGQHMLCLPKPGCGKLVYCEFGDKVISGDTEPQNQMAVSLSDWHNIKLVVYNHQVKAFIDQKPILDVRYKKGIGSAKGVEINFEGDGKVDWIKISNHAGKVQEVQDFGTPNPELTAANQ